MLAARVGWPEAEVTAVVGLAALGGTAEGDGVVEMFFLGAIVSCYVEEELLVEDCLEAMAVLCNWWC